MTYRIEEAILQEYSKKDLCEIIEAYVKAYRSYLESIDHHEQMKEVKSGYNRINRLDLWSCKKMNIQPRVGDICYIDYGQAYLNESGFQHFGLILGEYNQKILVVPMTSKHSARNKARNTVIGGRKHLYYLGMLEGLTKPSTLFLNDFKYLNSSRIISINGHIPKSSGMFQEIHKIIQEEFM